MSVTARTLKTLATETESSVVPVRFCDGRFGPHPHVWTLYVAVHGVGAITTLGAAIFGFSQHLSGQSPWALWALPAAPVLAGLVWALAFVGQSLGANQMVQLRHFVDAVAESSVAERSVRVDVGVVTADEAE